MSSALIGVAEGGGVICAGCGCAGRGAGGAGFTDADEPACGDEGAATKTAAGGGEDDEDAEAAALWIADDDAAWFLGAWPVLAEVLTLALTGGT